MLIEVALRPAIELVPSETNARRHSAEQIAQIRASIEAFGFTKPILEDGGEIVAGHGATLAALSIYEAGGVIRLPNGQELPRGTVPTISCAGWSDAQRRAYVIADNAIAENSEWDEALRGLEIRFLDDAGFDVALTGLDAKAIQAALADADGRGGFLSDLTDGAGDGDDGGGLGKVSSSTINLTFAVTPSERDQIIDWLSVERRERGLATNAAALAAIAKERVGQPATVKKGKTR